MKRRSRRKPTNTLEERLADFARRLREQAKSLPSGAEREDIMRRARQAETGLQVTEWLRPPPR